MKIRSDGGQVAIGNTVGGDLVQSGSGQQVALGNDVAGDLVQDGGEEGQ